MPHSSASSARLPTQIMSLGSSSQRQTGSGVPQKRFRERFQSRAPASQLPKRPEPTASGTQWVRSLFATSSPWSSSTFMNQVEIAMYSSGVPVR